MDPNRHLNPVRKGSLPTPRRIGSDPQKSISKRIGPGVWYTIHKLAIRATTKQKALSFIETLNVIVREFPCDECRKHGISFMERTPPENYLDLLDTDGNMIGMFRWSWEFHNTANRGLKKSTMSFDDAYAIYNNDQSVCLGNCGEDVDRSKITVTRSEIYTPATKPDVYTPVTRFTSMS